MTNKVINIIRPINYGAEKEYLKEFFRFIGCFLSDVAVDTEQVRAWNQALKPCNEEDGVDIVINFFGEDPYLAECRFRRIKRLYCYFSFQKHERYAFVADRPLLSENVVPRVGGTKAALRTAILSMLIAAIWKEEPDVMSRISRIATMYTGGPNGDLFFYIQARRSLRFLKMSEVLEVPNARVDAISYKPYINQCLTGLWELWVQLEGTMDPYSQYAQVKTGKMMRDIVLVLREEDRPLVGRITFKGKPFQTPTIDILIYKLQMIIRSEPKFLSAQTYLAGISRYSEDSAQSVFWYERVLNWVPKDKWNYAFIWYRKGHYYEKKTREIHKALECYRKTVEIDPQYYQALFKLGFYAASAGRFSEAEQWLKQTIQTIFHGRSTEAEQNGTYPNWLALSLKESQYVFKTYMMLAKIAINCNREYSAKSYIGKACMAATRFDEATLVYQMADPREFDMFKGYHQMSEHVWAIWKVLEPWTEEIILDYFLRGIVRERMARWPNSQRNSTPGRRTSFIKKIQ